MGVVEGQLSDDEGHGQFVADCRQWRQDPHVGRVDQRLGQRRHQQRHWPRDDGLVDQHYQ